MAAKHELKIQESHAPDFRYVFAPPHFASKVSYSAAPQTFAMPYKLSIRGRR